jgi:hypothetical protein
VTGRSETFKEEETKERTSGMSSCGKRESVCKDYKILGKEMLIPQVHRRSPGVLPWRFTLKV